MLKLCDVMYSVSVCVCVCKNLYAFKFETAVNVVIVLIKQPIVMFMTTIKMKNEMRRKAQCQRFILLQSLTDITDKLVDVWFLQQAQLTHTGEGVEGLVDDKLLSIAQALLQQRL